MNVTCPTLDELKAFHLGHLPNEHLDTITAHVETCTTCEHHLVQLEAQSDDLLQGLRGQEPPPSMQPRALAVPTLPGYEVTEVLGQGGMGVVYRAKQTRLHRTVALKRMRTLTNEDHARFRSEALAAARLQHPNIVQVFEVFDHAGEQYLALEFVAGVTLARHLDEGPLEARAAAELVATLATAVQHAHERGVIHRDLKPANVLLGAAGPKITDFGIAKRLESDTQADASYIAGTPSYMAPEQALGKPTAPTVDIYGLGAILYELFTGRPPLQGATPLETLTMLQTRDPLPPSAYRPSVPRDLETICLKCLHKEPRSRYASGSALADDLQRYLEGRPIVARPTSRWEHAVKWVRRHPTPAVSVAIVLVVTVAAFVAVTLALLESRKQTRVAERQLLVTNTALYAARLDQAQAAQRAGNKARALTLLDECPSSLRGWEWHYLKKSFTSMDVTLTGLKGSVKGLAVNPHQPHVAAVSDAGDLCIWNLETGERIVTSEATGQAYTSLAYHPDGTQLAVGRVDGWVELRAATGAVLQSWKVDAKGLINGVAFAADGRLATCGMSPEVYVWNTATQTRLLTCKGNTTFAWRIAFQPDGQQLATAGADGSLRTWNATTGQPNLNLRLQAQSCTFFSLAYSPDGQRLAGCGHTNTSVVRVWDAKGNELKTWTNLPGRVHDVCWDSAGRWLATACGNGRIKLFLTDTWQEQLELDAQSPVTQTMRLAFATDGRRLVSASMENTVRVWPVRDTVATPLVTGQVDDAATFRSTLVFSPDGTHLAGYAGPNVGRGHTIVLWKLEGKTQRFSLDTNAPITAISFKPDGARLAAADEAGMIQLWDMTSRKKIREWPAHDGACRTLAFHPEGSDLASGGDDGMVKLWDVDAMQTKFVYRGHADKVQSLAFAPGGPHLASCDAGGELHVWHPSTGRELFRRTADAGLAPYTVAYGPLDSGLLAFGGNGKVALYEAANGRQTQTLERGLRNPVFSPDGKRLIAASNLDKSALVIVDTHTGQQLFVLREGPLAVVGVAVSPDGRHLAVVHSRFTGILWDALPE